MQNHVYFFKRHKSATRGRTNCGTDKLRCASVRRLLGRGCRLGRDFALGKHILDPLLEGGKFLDAHGGKWLILAHRNVHAVGTEELIHLVAVFLIEIETCGGDAAANATTQPGGDGPGSTRIQA